MVKSLFGLLRQNQVFTTETRCNEGRLTDPELSTKIQNPPSDFLCSSLISSSCINLNQTKPSTVYRSGYLHFLLALIGCKGSQNLIRM
ncbi:hypothetical protein YEEN111655_13105 [Yersinia entomophaga]|nr:hypothetical protein B4914_05995 [Yersinia entomophaga]